MLRKLLGRLLHGVLLMLLLALLARPAFAGRRASIKQFEQGLAEAKGKPDKEFAKWVFGFELNERVSGARLARWKEGVTGEEGKRALGAIADLSAFLSLPADEIPKTAALDKDGQQRVLAAAGTYVEQTLSKLPNFFATQAITTFDDTPASRDGSSFFSYVPLHYEDFTTATVQYRNGKEVMETHKGAEVADADQTISTSSGLLSSGEFGPVLHTVLSDSRSGKLAWTHWETQGTTLMAVFRYSVPRGKSHYKVKAELPGHATALQMRPGYHGEIGIDPENGTILRLTLLAEMTDEVPLDNADLMVEYGPVEIGGKSYICPVRSVASVEAFQVVSRAGAAESDTERPAFQRQTKEGAQKILNDVVFGHYQVLRSDARVLTGADLEDDPKNP
jgi:hypothetical protein